MDALTPDEIRFFKRQGYLIKRGVLDPELMARARERKWESAPARMKRDDTGTWFGPFRPDEELVEDPENFRSEFTWKYTAPKHEPWIVAMFATKLLLGWAEQLLGNEAYKRRIMFNADSRVEGHGVAGALAHTAGWNRSPRQLREAVLCDYQKRADALPERAGTNPEPDGSFWHGWSHEVRSPRHD